MEYKFLLKTKKNKLFVKNFHPPIVTLKLNKLPQNQFLDLRHFISSCVCCHKIDPIHKYILCH